MIKTTLQDALCARCAVTIYGPHPVYYRANGGRSEVREFQDRLELAASGIELIDASGAPFRPLAVTFVAGTALCGPCAHHALQPGDPLGMFRRR